MTDEEFLAHVRAIQWKEPMRKLRCLLAPRRHRRYVYDWATGHMVIAVRCERCRQGHV